MSLFHDLQWLDLLDIAIVAFLIYRLVLLIKNAMAVRILLGIVIALIVFTGAQLLGLSTLSWIVGNLLGSLVVVLAIIFQHDIRRVLLTIGRKGLNRSRGAAEVTELIEELADAVESLVNKKIGALLVIERDTGVDDFIEVGTEIDAKVTSELINSIFLPYSPIHDGAVIIQKGKLTKAGCFLPLSANPEISKALGTRHRAAIGLTEQVDAVVLVVSEETGRISLVVGGRITPELDLVSLRKLLKKLLESQHQRWLK